MKTSIYSVTYSIECKDESEAIDLNRYLICGEAPDYIIDAWDDGSRVMVELAVESLDIPGGGVASQGKYLVSKLIDKYKESTHV